MYMLNFKRLCCEKKYFIQCLVMMCLNNFSCFSTEETDVLSNCDIAPPNLSSWNYEIYINFLKSEKNDINRRTDVAANILKHPHLDQHHQEVAPLAIALMKDPLVHMNRRTNMAADILESDRLSLYHQEVASFAVALIIHEYGNIDRRADICC